MLGRQVKDYAVLGTLSLARSIGEIIADNQQLEDPVQGLVVYL